MALLIMIISIGFSGCKSKYVKYDNIDEIEYAEPTEYAKNFDIEGYISKLPEVEYKKINYPVKETYTYKFNNYEMTIDIPEGFEVKEIPLKEKPKIVNSTSIEDSCVKYGMRSIATCGNDKGFLKSEAFIQSDKSLEIASTNNINCGTMRVAPRVSKYKGINSLDAFIRYVIPIKNYNQKYQDNIDLFLVVVPQTKIQNYAVIKLLNEKYMLIINQGYSRSCINKNLFFSILDSIKIEKKK